MAGQDLRLGLWERAEITELRFLTPEVRIYLALSLQGHQWVTSSLGSVRVIDTDKGEETECQVPAPSLGGETEGEPKGICPAGPQLAPSLMS